VSQALSENDWDDWEDEIRQGVRNQFRWSLQALACSAEDQFALFPNFVSTPYELASDFNHWSKAALSKFAGKFSEDQLAAIRAIDELTTAMSRGGPLFDEALWDDEALGARSEWEQLRSLGKTALACFDWPMEKPPWGRSVYSGGDSAE
jgi:hypothetical protein